MNVEEATWIFINWLLESNDSQTCKKIVHHAGEQIRDGQVLPKPIAEIIGKALIDTARIGNSNQFLNPPGVKRTQGRPHELSQAITCYFQVNELEQIEKKKNPENKKSLQTACKQFALEAGENARTVEKRFQRNKGLIEEIISSFSPEEGVDLFKEIFVISNAEIRKANKPQD